MAQILDRKAKGQSH